jgi:hypothetical protein
MSLPERVEHPTTVAGIDWRQLQKGDYIEHEQILEAFDILFPNRAGIQEASFKVLGVRDWLTARRQEEGIPLVFKQTRGGLAVLTDADAVGYLNGQATAGLRKHRNNTRRMFVAIDMENLTAHQRQTLETNQARHALISSAVEGARRQTVSLLRAGARLPQLTPPDA